ncbi:MAG: hypothetical protein KME21_16055 [Desmonostoc vinosum HA7617-LM4]|jgi:hypothetical protein|nr:hypothetical protein [Desmonostoc vinosum HA7617-LM4]
MAKIMISDLRQLDTNMSLGDINSVDIDDVLGNYFMSLWGGQPNSLELTNMTDSASSSSTTYHGPFGVYDNKFFTIDFSRLIMNFIIVT